jgi:RNA-binding protein YhbY
MQKYHIKLTEAERQTIKKAISKKTVGQQIQKRGKILLDLDESGGARLYTTKKIAGRQGISEATISEVCKRYEAGGVVAVLERKSRTAPPVPAKVTGEVEAHIIATCCSAPPEGKGAWSMQMIADKIVLDGIVDSISDETVRLVLKKQSSSRI